VSIVTGYGLDNRNFSVHLNVHTSSDTFQVSYPMGTGLLFLGIKLLVLEADHSLSSSAEVNDAWSYTLIPHRIHDMVLN
jgi:hypothetical protein